MYNLNFYILKRNKGKGDAFFLLLFSFTERRRRSGHNFPSPNLTVRAPDSKRLPTQDSSVILEKKLLAT